MINEPSAPHDVAVPYLRLALQVTTLNHPWLPVSIESSTQMNISTNVNQQIM